MDIVNIKTIGEKKTMIVYQNRQGYIMSLESFKRLNKGKRLSKSQMGLLGLKKIKINNMGEKTNDTKSIL